MSDQDGGFNKDSIGNIIMIAVLVCLGCSIVVSGAAVGLKSVREDNAALDKVKTCCWRQDSVPVKLPPGSKSKSGSQSLNPC